MNSVEMTFTFEDGNSQTFNLKKSSLLIGRSNDCDVVLPFEGFSRKHCQIDIEDGEIYLTDLKSANGVIVGGEKIIPEKKTAYKTFLSLQMGSAISVTISLEEATAGVAPHLATSPRPQVSQDDSTRMSKRAVSDHTKPHLQRRPEKKTVDKTEAENKKFMGLVFVVILAVAGYYFYSTQETTSEPSAEIAGPTTEVAPAPLETNFVSTNILLDSVGKQNCLSDKEKEWCSYLALNPEKKEGIVIKDDSVVAFLNLTEMRKLITEANFQNLKTSDQHELLILRKLVQGIALSKLKNGPFTNIQLVGLENESPVYEIKINKDYDSKVFKRALVYGVIDDGMNLGKADSLELIRPSYKSKILP